MLGCRKCSSPLAGATCNTTPCLRADGHLTELRMALHQDQPIGNDRFYREIEAMTGQRRELRKRARPRKRKDDGAARETGQADLPL